MSVGRWVEHLAGKGIHLEADQGRLRIRAAKGVLDDADLAMLSSRKVELLDYLRDRLPPIDPLCSGSVTSDVPLSSAQQRLWFLASLGDGSDAYSISAALRLEGKLNVAALERAITEILRRHDVLRARFVAVDDHAVQRIEPPSALVLEPEDVSAFPAPEQEATQRAQAFAAQPFQLATGPLFRVRLWRLNPLRHVLAFAVHHIVFDGWSLKVLMQELSALYTAYSRQEPSPLPDLPIRYADYVAWQQRRLTSEVLEDQAEYWRKLLNGAPAQSTFPADRPRPPIVTQRGETVRFAVPAAVAQGVRALARQSQATPFMVLLAAWVFLLSRSSSQEDVVVGTPVAGRNRQEMEPLLGLFVNTLALRFDLADLGTLGAWIERVKGAMLAAYEHQEMPFERVVDVVVPERQMHHHPLIQTVFVLQSAASRTQLNLPDLTVASLPLVAQSAKFDLVLEATESTVGLAAVLEYNADLYERATAETIAERWVGLLEAIVQPGAATLPLNSLPVMTSAERQRLLSDWGANPRPYRREHTLTQAFAEQVSERPDAVAVSCGTATLTYRDLDVRANRLAHHLIATNRVGPDILVALVLERSIELIVTLLAILKTGAAYMPISRDEPAARLAHMLKDVPLIVTTRALAERLPLGPLAVCIDADAALIAQQESSAPESAAGPASLAYALYTSGSTGEPKGVLVEQRSVMRLVDNAGFAELGPDSTVLHLAPLNFDASTFEIWGPLLTGGRLVVMEAGTPSLEDIGAAIRHHGVDTLWLTAGLFQAMVDERVADFAPLRQLLAGGDVVSPAHVGRVLAAHPHLTVINGYGPTETTTFAACHHVRAGEALAGGVPIGRPIGNTYVYVCDRRGELVAPGVAGELLIGGDGVAREYRRRPDLTAERFVPDPCRPGGRLYRTGDLVRWRNDGVLEFLGRLDDQVKIRGFRVELSEVEAAILTHPEVASAAVMAHADAKGGKHLTGYVVPRAGVEPYTLDVAAWLDDRLPPYMRPQHWQMLSELPLTANGKLDRAKLPRPQERLAPKPQTPPRSATESILVELWAKLLDRSDIGIHDNFFELGGDSILSLQIVTRCREVGLKLLPRQIFQHQTIAELAAHVTSDIEQHDAIEQGPIEGPVAHGPIQQWFYGLQLRDPHHFNQSVLLTLAPEIGPRQLSQALAALVMHHDMLRLRVADVAREPKQWIAAPGDEVPLDVVAPGEIVRQDDMKQTLARAQAGLDLEKGPIIRALFFPPSAGRAARLLLVIHHLAVDGVSWRILLEDLETACGAVLAGRPVVLPRKTVSFGAWVEQLAAEADSTAVAADLAYWQTMPADHSQSSAPRGTRANLVGTARKIRRVFLPELTRDLLQHSAHAYNTRVDDMLLTALLLSSHRLTSDARLRINLEGHGRHTFGHPIDLSRTVGWFTCAYPVDLIMESEALGDALVGVKEQLRRVPGQGLAYAVGRWLRQRGHMALPAESGIVFNYLGQFDQMQTRTRLIRLSEESSGPSQGRRNRRNCLLEILSMVFDGCLRMEWQYHPAWHSREHIEAWADDYVATLTALVAHCCNPANGSYTPADFPSVELGSAEIEAIQALAAASNGAL